MQNNASPSLQLLQQQHPGRVLFGLEEAAIAGGKSVKTWRNHPHSIPFRTVKNGHLRQVHVLDLAAWLDSALAASPAPAATTTPAAEKRGRGRPRKASLRAEGEAGNV